MDEWSDTGREGGVRGDYRDRNFVATGNKVW